MDGLVRRVKDLDRRAFRRDLREVLVAATGAAAFVAVLPWIGHPWLRAWDVVLAASATGIAGWRAMTRLARRPGATSSLRDFCRAELRRVEIQVRLLRSLDWWYLAPIFVGTNGYVLATTDPSVRPTTSAVFLSVSLAVVLAIHWLNGVSLSRHILPLQVELRRCLEDLETDEGR